MPCGLAEEETRTVSAFRAVFCFGPHSRATKLIVQRPCRAGFFLFFVEKTSSAVIKASVYGSATNRNVAEPGNRPISALALSNAIFIFD